MPITVNQSHWRNITRTVTVQYEGETATVGYYPNRITPNLIEQVTSNKEDIGVLCNIIEQVVATWDVLGQPDALATAEHDAAAVATPLIPRQVPTPVGMYPLEAWALMQLPIAFLSAVTEAVFGAAVPNSQRTAATSPASS